MNGRSQEKIGSNWNGKNPWLQKAPHDYTSMRKREIMTSKDNFPIVESGSVGCMNCRRPFHRKDGGWTIIQNNGGELDIFEFCSQGCISAYWGGEDE